MQTLNCLHGALKISLPDVFQKGRACRKTRTTATAPKETLYDSSTAAFYFFSLIIIAHALPQAL
jgi:hypothetical protein